jgi:hypothetical protein
VCNRQALRLRRWLHRYARASVEPHAFADSDHLGVDINVSLDVVVGNTVRATILRSKVFSSDAPYPYSQAVPSPSRSSPQMSMPITRTGPLTYAGPLPLPDAQSRSGLAGRGQVRRLAQRGRQPVNEWGIVLATVAHGESEADRQ